ncbi:trypsin-like serine protease [Sorangium sp. So ce260]|uniref:trypsin-like serine protease n=1 Tax=Sorangium sp. So ce260 TaxID=3133291 RepID=UPI003F62C842
MKAGRATGTLAILALVGCSSDLDLGGPPPGDALEAAIMDGEPDRAHRAVFALRRSDSSRPSTASVGPRVICSSVLLSPDVLMTARHCVAGVQSNIVACGHSPFGALLPAEGLAVSNEPVLHEGAVWRPVSEIVVPGEGDDACGFDVALIVLERPVPPAIAAPASPGFEVPVSAGDAVTVVGYGRSGGADAPTARTAHANLEVVCVGAECGAGVAGSEFMTSGGPCEGDSGGPALDASGRVAGILSRGSDPCATPIFASVLAWQELILDVVDRGADLRRDPPHDGAGCSIGAANARSVAAVLFVLACLALRRRRGGPRSLGTAHRGEV